ncbi:hypothetical protein ACN28S_08515 [Cystobacter fuscus]
MAGAEQKLFSVLLVSTQTPGPEGATQVLKPGAAPRDALRAALKNSGAQVELLADGSLVATVMPERGTATDQAAVAARSALSFKEHWPEARWCSSPAWGSSTSACRWATPWIAPASCCATWAGRRAPARW